MLFWVLCMVSVGIDNKFVRTHLNDPTNPSDPAVNQIRCAGSSHAVIKGESSEQVVVGHKLIDKALNKLVAGVCGQQLLARSSHL